MGKNRGLYLPDAENDYAESRAKEAHDGNFNAYIVELIRNDRFGRLRADREDVILALMRSYDPIFEEEMKALLRCSQAEPNGVYSQKNLVKHFLEALRRALHAKQDLTWPFDLIPRSQHAEWQSTRSKYEQLLEQIARKLGVDEAALPFAAESPAPYGKNTSKVEEGQAPYFTDKKSRPQKKRRPSSKSTGQIKLQDPDHSQSA